MRLDKRVLNVEHLNGSGMGSETTVVVCLESESNTLTGICNAAANITISSDADRVDHDGTGNEEFTLRLA